MPLFKVSKNIFQRASEGQDLVVRGNQILFVSKEENSINEISHVKRSETKSACQRPTLHRSKNSKGPCNGAADLHYIHGMVSRKVNPKLSRAMTVDRGIQVDFIENESNGMRHGLSTGVGTDIKKNVKNMTTETTKDHSRANSNHHICTKLKEVRGSIESKALEKELVATLHSKEFTLVQKLKVLADECNSEPHTPLELKDSTYAVLKEKFGLISVNFPHDIEDNGQFNWGAKALIEAGFGDDGDDDDDDLAPQTLFTSVELLSSESASSSPLPLIKRKTLYPEPCPAFPMEVSFPPFPQVDFD